MLRDLDAESRLDRDPEFIQDMMAYGEKQAEEFLEKALAVAGGRTGYGNPAGYQPWIRSPDRPPRKNS